MKALVLAGGRGTRLSSVTDTGNKCMLEFKNRPLLEYNLERASEISDEIILLVGYKAEMIINRYGTSFKGKRIQYVIQNEQKGLVHAINCCRSAIGTDDFYLFLGDELLKNCRHKEMVSEFNKENLFGMCGVLKQKDTSKISKTYGVLSDVDGRIFRLIEKPQIPLNDFQGTGNCIFRNKILTYINKTPTHPNRGEKELPDLIQCAIDDGQIVKIFDICDKYINVNMEEDLQEFSTLDTDIN